MNRVLILEGTDLVGKTAIARELEMLGWNYEHLGPPDPTVNHIAQLLEMKEDRTVLDRWHLGSFIYQFAMRVSPACLTIKEFHQVVDDLRSRATTVVVRCIDSELTRRFIASQASGRQELFDLDTIIRVGRLYDAISLDEFGVSHIIDTSYNLDAKSYALSLEELFNA